MQTASGREFWPLDPRADEVHISDIVHALSNICRFGGHSSFYSVAQHSVLVSERCDPADALWGLLHDAAEAYIGDIVRPLKRLDVCAPLRRAEKRIQEVIAERFGLTMPEPTSVHLADMRMLATEAEQLMNAYPADWNIDVDPYPDLTIEPEPPRAAMHSFLYRFHALTGAAK
jgi:hypothetical protein